MAGFARSASSARSSKPGADSTSTNCSAMRAPSSAGDRAVQHHDAAVRRQRVDASARSYASSIVPPTATPHGFACLTITHAGSVNSSSERPRGREVVEVVERELLAVHLLDPESRWRRACASA